MLGARCAPSSSPTCTSAGAPASTSCAIPRPAARCSSRPRAPTPPWWSATRAGLAGRLVLLGDTVELRHGPVREALAAAGPALQALGEALDGATEVVLVP